jgi:hypothetical protein
MTNSILKTVILTGFAIVNIALFNVQGVFAGGEKWDPWSGFSWVTQASAYNSFFFSFSSTCTVRSDSSVGHNDIFDENATYEHETQVYTKAFADYDGYWSSNLPAAYYDTPFMDKIDNFTIGSAQASLLCGSAQYYTNLSLKKGKKKSATVRIKGQKGHRFPSGCTSTWCIFADATTKSLKKFTAPGGGRGSQGFRNNIP